MPTSAPSPRPKPADTQLGYLTEKYVRRALPAGQTPASVVAELRCQSAKTLTRLRDEFIRADGPGARTALSGVYGKRNLVERLASMVISPDVPITLTESARALAQVQNRIAGARAIDDTPSSAQLEQRLKELGAADFALRRAWKGPTRDVLPMLAPELEAAVRATIERGDRLIGTDEVLTRLTVQLAELPYALLDNLEDRIRNAAPPELYQRYQPARKRSDKIRNALGLMMRLDRPEQVSVPTSSQEVKRLIEETEQQPETPARQALLDVLQQKKVELSEAERKHEGWRIDLGLSIPTPGIPGLGLMGINFETHRFGKETNRFLTTYAMFPAVTPVGSVGMSFPIKKGLPSFKNVIPSFRASWFGWGRWGPLAQYSHYDASLTAEGGDMMGVTLGTQVFEKHLGRPENSLALKPFGKKGLPLFPMVGVFRRSPWLGETPVGNFFRRLAVGGDRINRAIQDAFYSSYKWLSEAGWSPSESPR